MYNLSRAALLATAFCEDRYELPVATKDMLHQPYRLPLIEGGEKVFALAKSWGAGTFIGGAGPTILAVVRTERRRGFFARAGGAWRRTRSSAHFTAAPLRRTTRAPLWSNLKRRPRTLAGAGAF
ncbi:MAG: hypothetical protein V8T36_08160 [Ruthenibacterium lactatiformans]